IACSLTSDSGRTSAPSGNEADSRAGGGGPKAGSQAPRSARFPAASRHATRRWYSCSPIERRCSSSPGTQLSLNTSKSTACPAAAASLLSSAQACSHTLPTESSSGSVGVTAGCGGLGSEAEGAVASARAHARASAVRGTTRMRVGSMPGNNTRCTSARAPQPDDLDDTLVSASTDIMQHDQHFLARLERLEREHAEIALGLYYDSALVRHILRVAKIPDETERVALCLGAPEAGPHVIVARDGHFVTCLAEGMQLRADQPVISRHSLD